MKIWFSYEDLQYYCKSSNYLFQEVVRFSPHIDSNSIHCVAHSSWNKKFLSFCIRRDTMMTSSQFITGVTLYRHGAQNFWLTRSHKTYPCQKQQKKNKNKLSRSLLVSVILFLLLHHMLILTLFSNNSIKLIFVRL